MYKQDDPKKCTAAKLVRFGIARPLRSLREIPRGAVVLDPFSKTALLPSHKPMLKRGLVAIDCSWKLAEKMFTRRMKGVRLRLPILLSANPAHYSRPFTLSSAEAMAAALYITHYTEEARSVLLKFKWGEVFFALNEELLKAYGRAETQEEVVNYEKKFFPGIFA